MAETVAAVNNRCVRNGNKGVTSCCQLFCESSFGQVEAQCRFTVPVPLITPCRFSVVKHDPTRFLIITVVP